MSGYDYYTELGVAPSATETEIRDSYRRLARRFHPDLNPGDNQALARLKTINAAYEVLSDPERRRAYDQAAAPHPAAPASSTEQLQVELAQVNRRLAAVEARLAQLGQQQAAQAAEVERWERRIGLAQRHSESDLAEAARLRAEQIWAQAEATDQQLERTRGEAGRLRTARRALLAVLEHRA